MVGNRVLVYRKSQDGSHGDSRKFLDDAVTRLSKRYGFSVTISEDSSIFNDTILANTKVVLMSNGFGDVVRPGPYRTNLENFQFEKGWGLIWIHAACSFITTGWPFGRQSCVQQYFHHNGSGTQRRVFLDSGTILSPNHGRKNPQSEFLVRALPSWYSHGRTFGDEFFCFQAPVRDSDGVNVLIGYDRSSGLPAAGCPQQADQTISGSWNHHLAWTHLMGKGISIIHTIGHDNETYTGASNAGDSLLWRYIRYAAKDWCASDGNAEGCNSPVTGFQAIRKPARAHSLNERGVIRLEIRDPGNHTVWVSDVSGRLVKKQSLTGPGTVTVPGLQRGIYGARIQSATQTTTQRFTVF